MTANVLQTDRAAALRAPLMIWLPLSVGGAYVTVFVFQLQEQALSWKLLLFVVGTILGTAFAVAGNVLRKFARPDSIIIRGGFFAIIGEKVFWLIGPQFYGALLGSILGTILLDAAIHNYLHQSPVVTAASTTAASHIPSARHSRGSGPVVQSGLPQSDTGTRTTPTPVEPASALNSTTESGPAITEQPAARANTITPSSGDPSPPPRGPSFDCAKAVSVVENLICKDPTLANADSDLASAYKKALLSDASSSQAAVDSLRSSERVFVAQRNQCTTAECVAQAYRERLTQLTQSDSNAAQVASPQDSTTASIPDTSGQAQMGEPANPRKPGLFSFLAQSRHIRAPVPATAPAH